MTIEEMKIGDKAIVKDVEGGHSMKNRLESMGLRIGVEIEKKSRIFTKGPVIVKITGTEIAIGHGMAKQIIVEMEQSR